MTYNYQLSAFLNQKCDPARLDAEIRTTSISVALESIVVLGPTVSITFKAALSAAEVTTLDGLVAAHSGSPLAQLVPQAVQLQPFSAITRNVALSGHRQVCMLNATTDLDISWAEEREVQGAELAIRDFFDGDYVTASLRHPVAGELIDFGKSYVKPDGKISLSADTTKVVPAGLILRISYTSTTSTGNQPVLYVDVKTWR